MFRERLKKGIYKMNFIDNINVEQFNTKYEKGKYICSNCHEIVRLNDSGSYEGYNLVCNRCLWRIEHITGDFPLPKIQAIGKMRQENEQKREENNNATSL